MASEALLVFAIGIALVLGVVLYFLPVIIAVRWQHPQAGAIAVVNVCLGWTLIGWVAALAWALAQRPAQPSLPRH